MPAFGLRSWCEHERADRVGEAEFVSRREFERCLRPICRLSQQLAHLGEVRCAGENRNQPAEERQRKTVTVRAIGTAPPSRMRARCGPPMESGRESVMERTRQPEAAFSRRSR